jgi:polysaccharide chain length determinant protein (PEP-CTERM system associated)
MEELLAQINAYLRGMWRYRWWGLALAWVVALGGIAFVYQMPDQYRSTARVFVDTQSVIRPLMRGLAVQPNVEQQVAVLSRTLITRPNIEKLITMADLDLTIRNQAEREVLISELQSGLRISDGGRRGGSNMFSLSYQDISPERAQRVVQALVSLFVESGLVSQRQDTDDARRFIETQIAAYEQRLIEAENRVKEFRLRNMALLGDGNRDFVSQIGSLAQQLAQTDLEIRETAQTRESLQQQLAGESPMLQGSPFPDMGMMNPAIMELDSRIDTLNRRLDELLLRYTDRHPDVVATRAIIATLEGQRQQEEELQTAIEADSTAPMGGGTNPVFQQIRIALSNADARLAALSARKAEIEERIQDLRQRAELIPQIEAEQARLNRDYSVHKSNYDALVSRRESAAMTAQLDAQSGAGDFRVIEPPSLPRQPSAPNRQLLVSLVGLAALGSGIAITFLIAQIRPTIIDGRTLRNVTGLPVLGSVSLIPDRGVVRARRLGLVMFSSLVVMLGVSIGAAALAIQIFQR